jgi:serine phosphatase RsbU (regulator of sigma subunit)
VAQDFSDKKQQQVDSLNNLISNPNSNDTTLAAAYIILSEMYLGINTDTLVPMAMKAITIAEKGLDSNPSIATKKELLTILASAYNNIGFVHKNHGEIKEALNFYHKGLKIREEINDTLFIANSLLNIGYIYSNQGDLPKALEYFHKSLKLQESINDKKGISYTLNNIGYVHDIQDNLSEALDYYHKSLKLREELGNKRGIGVILLNIGGIYRKKEEPEKALSYFEKSIKFLEEVGDKRGIANCLNNIGAVYNKQGKIIEALSYFNKGIILREETGDKRGVAYSYINIGRSQFELGEVRNAEKSGLNSLEIGNEIGIPDIIMNAAKLLSEVYEKQAKGMSALEMYKLHITMRDSLNNEKNRKATAKQHAKYEYEKQKAIDDARHDKLLAIEQEEKEKQQILTGTTTGGLGLVVVFLIFVFNRLRVTKKQKLVIEEQKQEVEQQKEVVEAAHFELEEKNKEILDSITYAKRIQSAILPPMKIVKEYLNESFILYKPKDIVAGDFYWMEHINGKILFAAADCTGHGVPGAMVSVVCNNGLNRTVREHGLTSPGEILDKTREIVVAEFEKSEEEVKDGMDIALCSLEGNKLQYAGAHNPLWIIRNNEIIETKANKQPIGKFDNPVPYKTHSFELEKGDSIYIFSDGYVDQFGGEKGKKLKAKAFRELLLSIQDKNMEEQKIIIDEAFENWRGSLEQIDDVCIIGIRF